MNRFFFVFLLFLSGVAEENTSHNNSFQPTPTQIQDFRNGNIVAFATYIGKNTPIIMVSVYQRDITVLENNNGKPSEIIIGTSYARVVQSYKSEIKVGAIIVFNETKEELTASELHHFSHPKGSLYYIISPQIKLSDSQYFLLAESRPPIKINGTYYPATFYN